MPRSILLEPLPADGMYALHLPVSFQVGDRLYHIPKGFKTDGASIPRFAWFTTGTPFDPRHIRAAVIHDFMYQHGAISRQLADALFREMLLEDGVPEYLAGKMYWSLRLFGWAAWRAYRRNKRRRYTEFCPDCDVPMTKVPGPLGENQRVMCEQCGRTHKVFE